MIDKTVRRGDIFWCPVMEVNAGGEMYVGDPRPVVVVSNDRGNETSGSVTIVPITTKPKKPFPMHVEIQVNRICGTVLCEKISLAVKENFGIFCGVVPEEKMREIDEAIRIQLSLSEENETETYRAQKPSNCLNNDLQTALITQERDLYKKLYEQLLEKLSAVGK